MPEVIEATAIEKTLVYREPVTDVMVSAADRVLDSVRTIVIDSDGTYAAYAEELVDIKRSIKEIDDFREKLKKPFLDGGRSIDDLFRAPLAKRREAADLVNSALTKYRQDAEQKRRAEQKRLDDLAAAERKKAADEAATLAAAGRVDEAQAVVDRAAVTSSPVLPAAVPKVAGVSSRKVWKGRIVDTRALFLHLAEHPEDMGICEFKQGELDARARMYKGALKLPGVVAEEVESTTVRT